MSALEGLEATEVYLGGLNEERRIDSQYFRNRLLDAAKRAVEIAIQDSETAALNYLESFK